MSNYFAIFYVLGILFFALFIRARFKQKNDDLKKICFQKEYVDKELAKKIVEDAKNQRKARGINEDS
ncbi:MAG: hypothetical protein CMG75_01920 [Candidatus Marinimicrobia bacterium]|nr:hypothetical protein [Candidatus Neomarinimicrobiota bacterium]|tara:strand:- start:19785 stop:19985 length:201 start_codon:yes stop_codon:yes gene_type:complete